jgi:hypothetical protein
MKRPACTWIVITALSALLMACSGGGGGGSGSGGGSGGGDGGGGSTGAWNTDGRMMEISQMTLSGVVDEPADIVVNGATISTNDTTFEATYTPAELGVADVLHPNGATVGPSWSLSATDGDGNTNELTVNPVLQP